MKRFRLFKLTASANDFLLFYAEKKASTSFYRDMARQCCRRRYSWGADGLLVIEKKKSLYLRIFNPDGSEAEMCGNGARCAALWIYQYIKKSTKTSFLTKAGEVKAVLKRVSRGITSEFILSKAVVKLKMTDPKQIKVGLGLKVSSRILPFSFINTGVPHAVIFVGGLKEIDVDSVGRIVRYHKKFLPSGTNVDFVEFINDNFIQIRTYERGVEAETLACGTGVVAGAILHRLKNLPSEGASNKVSVLTRSGEIMRVYFRYQQGDISDVWLEGRAYLLGEILI